MERNRDLTGNLNFRFLNVVLSDFDEVLAALIVWLRLNLQPLLDLWPKIADLFLVWWIEAHAIGVEVLVLDFVFDYHEGALIIMRPLQHTAIIRMRIDRVIRRMLSRWSALAILQILRMLKVLFEIIG